MSRYLVVADIGFEDHGDDVDATVRALTPVGDETTLSVHGTHVVAYHTERQHSGCAGHHVARAYDTSDAYTMASMRGDVAGMQAAADRKIATGV